MGGLRGFLGFGVLWRKGDSLQKVVSRPEVRAVVDLLSTQKVSIHRPVVELAPVDGLCQDSMSSDDARSAHHSKSKRDAIGCDMRSVFGAQSGGMVVVEFNERMNCRWGNPREFHLGPVQGGTSLEFFLRVSRTTPGCFRPF